MSRFDLSALSRMLTHSRFTYTKTRIRTDYKCYSGLSANAITVKGVSHQTAKPLDLSVVAERVGFEPTDPLITGHSISSATMK